jgi:hypothetical protein
MPPITLGHKLGDRVRADRVVKDQQPTPVKLKPPAHGIDRLLLIDVAATRETQHDGEASEIRAQRRRLLCAQPRDHVIPIAVRARVAGSQLRLADPAHPMNRVHLRHRDRPLIRQPLPQPLQGSCATDERARYDRHVEDRRAILRASHPPTYRAARVLSRERGRLGGLRAFLRDTS